MSLTVVLIVAALLLLAPALAVLFVVIALLVPNPVRAIAGLFHPATPADFVPVRLANGTAAWWIPNTGAGAAVLVCHGRSRSKRWMLPLIQALRPHYHVLAFDFPGHGDSRGTVCTLGVREAATVDAALDLLEQRGVSDVVVYGVSMGGVAAIFALAARPRALVRALITDGSFDTLDRVIGHARRFAPLPSPLFAIALRIVERLGRFDPRQVRPVDAARRIMIPWLVLHGDRDPLVPVAASLALAEASTSARRHVYRGFHDQPRNASMQAEVLAFAAASTTHSRHV